MGGEHSESIVDFQDLAGSEPLLDQDWSQLTSRRPTSWIGVPTTNYGRTVCRAAQRLAREQVIASPSRDSAAIREFPRVETTPAQMNGIESARDYGKKNLRTAVDTAR